MAKLVKKDGETFMEIECCSSNPYINPMLIKMSEIKEALALLKEGPPKKEPVPQPTKKVASVPKKKSKR